ncbi:MAG: AMP-binding protein [Acidobacteria bacterium]|nr:AMP-binding protein [Acidobacteriota bacterium]
MSAETLDLQLRHWAQETPERVFLLSAHTQMTFSEAEAQVERQAQRLAENWHGGALLLAGVNDQSWALNLLGALRSRIPVVLIPQGWTTPEKAQLTELAGATLKVEADVLQTINAETAYERMADWKTSGASLGFVTSGSTGRSRLALRSAESLLAEGARYQMLWHITQSDVLAAVLPLSHAYTFGAALAAALVAGSTLVLEDFIAPRRVARLLTEKRVTILPLVGPVARSLARLDAGQPVQSDLRMAMVGGGVVTDEMSQLFNAKWGLALSQNYGSSETGAMLASFPPHSTKGTGFPMPGVECRLSEAVDGTGQLWVRMSTPLLGYMTENGFEAARLSPGGWLATGDLFLEDDGLYTMMGRLGQQIRRGGRTIHPREIERVLLKHAAVDEVLVRGGKDSDEQECIEAHVLLRPGAKASVAELREHVLSYLAPYKCPTRWHLEKEFPRTWSHKPAIKSDNAAALKKDTTFFNSLLSHRLSTAIVTAEATGLLDELAKKSGTTEQLAETLSLDPEALSLFLKLLSAMGVVADDGAEGYRLAEVNHQWWKPAIALEASLQQTWLTAQSVGDVLRGGLHNRPFDRARTDAGFNRLYRDAMCGVTQAAIARQITRLFKLSLRDGARSLEIGRGIGILSMLLRQQLASPETELIALAPAPALICEDENQESQADTTSVCAWTDIIPAPGRFNLIFVMNAIHWLKPAEAKTVFARLLGGLSPGGQLLIADMFLPAGDHAGRANMIPWIFLLDWMTHGGTNFLTVSEVEEQLTEASAGEVGHRSLGNLPFEIIHASR